MREYPKTQNLFVRDPDTHKLIVGELRDPANAQIGRWFVTEKVDGTNIRVLLQLKQEKPTATSDDLDLVLKVNVRGRSDNANLPAGLEQTIRERIESCSSSTLEWVTELTAGDPDNVVCLYGEGYGPGIQKAGGNYRPQEAGKSIRLFDVTTTRLVEGSPTGTWWREWDTVEAAATATGLQTVPVLSRDADLDSVVENVYGGFHSHTAEQDGGEGLQAEGVVARTDPYLYDFRGHRMMFKLKAADLA